MPHRYCPDAGIKIANRFWMQDYNIHALQKNHLKKKHLLHRQLQHSPRAPQLHYEIPKDDHGQSYYQSFSSKIILPSIHTLFEQLKVTTLAITGAQKL